MKEVIYRRYYRLLMEQKEIVSYLDKILNQYKEITLKSQEQIKLMQERRTALISAAVTGKIDVRDWQAPQDAILS